MDSSVAPGREVDDFGFQIFSFVLEFEPVNKGSKICSPGEKIIHSNSRATEPLRYPCGMSQGTTTQRL